MDGRVLLDVLPRGQVAHVFSIGTKDEALYLRLHEMGFDEGIEVEVVHIGPFGGDPLAVRVGSAMVAMRRADAAAIMVDCIGPAMKAAAE